MFFEDQFHIDNRLETAVFLKIDENASFISFDGCCSFKGFRFFNGGFGNSSNEVGGRIGIIAEPVFAVPDVFVVAQLTSKRNKNEEYGNAGEEAEFKTDGVGEKEED